MNEPQRSDGQPRPSDVAPIVEAVGVSMRYGATTALHDVRLKVLPGESHALVGRNGAGKSTLVAILTGLRAPDAGEARFSGPTPPPMPPGPTVPQTPLATRQPTERGLILWSTLRRQARELLDRWNVAVSEDA